MVQTTENKFCTIYKFDRIEIVTFTYLIKIIIYSSDKNYPFRSLDRFLNRQ